MESEREERVKYGAAIAVTLIVIGVACATIIHRFPHAIVPSVLFIMLGAVFAGVSITSTKPFNPTGYRCGEPEETNAFKVFRHEVEELGNWLMVGEAAAKLRCRATLPAVLNAIEQRWGKEAKAIWLCSSEKDAVTNYGRNGEAYAVMLPENAFFVNDLGEEGKLYIYSA